MRPRVLIIQEVIPDFRIPFFNRLGQTVDLSVFYSDPTPLKRRMPPSLDKIRDFKAQRFGGFSWRDGRLTFHPKMLLGIPRVAPDAIILEARLGFLTALGAALVHRQDTKVAWWLSGYESPGSRQVRRSKNAIWRRFYGHADAFLCYSTAGQDYLQRFGIHKGVFVAYNALDTEEINFWREQTLSQGERWKVKRSELRRGTDIQLLYVGRIEPAKKLPVLLYALHRLKQLSVPYDFRLNCIGGGSDLDAMRALCHTLKLAELVDFVGPVHEQHRLAEYFLAADIFILPSAGGLAVNQAISYGLPVILSQADGSERDMVHDGQNGLFFQAGQSDDLAHKIDLLAKNLPLRSKMAKHSQHIAATTSNMTAMLDGFVRAIDYMLSKKELVSVVR